MQLDILKHLKIYPKKYILIRGIIIYIKFIFRDVPLVIPSTEVPPASWWDADADKSLLIGTYRYGYEQ